jgi:hypothetical protein
LPDEAPWLASHLALARQRIIGSAVELLEFIARKLGVAELEPGAMKAHRGGLFESKTDGVGGGAEGPRTLRLCADPVTAEIKLGWSLVIQMCHVVFL